MGRDPRICKPNLSYEIYSRCINHEDMMKDEKNKDMMKEIDNSAMPDKRPLFQMVSED